MLQRLMPLLASALLIFSACSQKDIDGITALSGQNSEIAKKQSITAGGQTISYDIEQKSDGSILFTTEFDNQQLYVEVFVRINKVQIAAVNIVSSETFANNVYTYSYSLPAAEFINADVIDARFYAYEAGKGGVFIPGPHPGIWADSIVYADSNAPVFTVTSSYIGTAGATATIVSPASVKQGEDLAVSVQFPAGSCGAQVDGMTINGVSADVANYSQNGVDFIIPDVQENIDVSFEISVPYITVEVGANGTVTPDTITASPYFGQSDVVYAIVADSGYEVEDVIVDGASQGALTSYTVAATVDAATCPDYHTIKATFKVEQPVEDYITFLPNGETLVQITFDSQQLYVEVFARVNNIQFLAVNVVSSEVANANGTYTYSYTIAADTFESGDAVDARFYAYEAGKGGVFIPGPYPAVWSQPVFAP